MDDKERLYELDLLRFLAAAMVVAFHYTFRGAVDMCDVSSPALGQVFRYGYLGVDLFFLISGFVVLWSAWNRDAAGFAISRIVRLYPAYWFCLTLTAIVTVVLGADRFHVSLKQWFWNLSMLQEFFHIESVDGVYWSLEVELKFYLLVFVLLLIRRMEQAQYFLGGWLAASAILTFYDGVPVAGKFLFPKFSSYFIAGATFYLIRRDGVSLYRAMVIAGSYALAMYWSWVRIGEATRALHTDFYWPVAALAISLFFVLFFLLATRRTSMLGSRHFVVLGLLTYPLYLLHQNIGFMIMNALSPWVNALVLLSLTFALMLAAAMVVNRYVETPLAPRLKRALSRAVVMVPRRARVAAEGHSS